MSPTAPVLPIAGFGISGFRTLSNVEVRSRGSLTVVCGANNSGKSSVLAALTHYGAWVNVVNAGGRAQKVSEASAETVKIAIDVRTTAFRAHIQSKLSDDARTADRLIEHLVDADEEPLWIHLDRRGDEIQLAGNPVPELNDLAQRWLENGHTRDVAKLLARVGGVQPGTPLGSSWTQHLGYPVVVPAIKIIGDVRRTLDAPLTDDQLFTLAQAATRLPAGQRSDPWAETLGLILKDVFGEDVEYSVRARAANGVNSGDFLIKLDGEDNRHLNETGAGVREVVAVAHAAVTGNAATVLCIEEPENCLHPRAVRRLLDSLVRRTNAQLFVTSHSAAVVNAGTDALIHLHRTGGTTTSTQVDKPSQRFEAIRQLGYSPADLVLTPCAVWVEGPSDRVYFTAWLPSVSPWGPWCSPNSEPNFPYFFGEGRHEIRFSQACTDRRCEL